MPKVNMLTTNMMARGVPLVLETLVKHYFDRLKREISSDGKNTNLKDDEILYHEAFNVVKTFLDAASHHTVEEVQAFSNTPTPSSPWAHVVRVLVPRASCDKAAEHIIRALGGEDACRRTVGGTKWWQVRGIDGVDGQWITTRKDWKEYQRREKEKEKAKKDGEPNGKETEREPEYSDDRIEEEGYPEIANGEYERDMDDMRCILYAHGGGYYFGSVDQERYSIQRHARKINGRVFAINYRLAPQYPFPCALQDLLAAYLFLIDPPPQSSHKPVNPAQIVVSGDSAGGGLTLALLQLIRDTPGLPLPAGGILISPWCDLTHSFPSIHTNTPTDVIPAHGLCMQKPSTLWPPPSDDFTSRVHLGLRSRLRHALKLDDPTYDPTVTIMSQRPPNGTLPIDIGTTTAIPSIDKKPELKDRIELKSQSGETLVIDQQVQMYTENSLLGHPLVSSAVSYMGGLPPLMFIASDGEVLRDEVIYVAHRAQYPERYPVRDEARALYPPLKGIEQRHPKPTQVHLQVYDDVAHVLPVLFLFTTPAKFCFRAMASFCKNVMADPSPASPLATSFTFQNLKTGSSNFRGRRDSKRRSSFMANDENSAGNDPRSRSRRSSFKEVRRSVSLLINSRGPKKERSMSVPPEDDNNAVAILDDETEPLPSSPPLSGKPQPVRADSDTSDVGGPRLRRTSSPVAIHEKYAGDPAVYGDHSPWQGGMIRERVSTQGVIRPLEPESELSAFKIPDELVCQLSELAVRRFLEAKARFDKKYGHILKKIEKQRRQHLERSKVDTIKHLHALRTVLLSEKGEQESTNSGSHTTGSSSNLTSNLSTSDLDSSSIYSSQSWSLAWALDDDERPPPSSIVARRDTHEARQLAMVADQSIMQTEHGLSGNNLWTALVNLMTNPPDKISKPITVGTSKSNSAKGGDMPRRSRLSRFISGGRIVSASSPKKQGESDIAQQ